MKKNLGHDQEDRGVEGGLEVTYVGGKRVVRPRKPAVDGLGQPAAPEDAMGND